MNIERFRQIIKYNWQNRDRMNQNLLDFYLKSGLERDKEILNLRQIVKRLMDNEGYIIVEMPFDDKEIGALTYKGDCRGYILLNSSLPKVNINFALAHEIYHVLYQKAEFGSKVELYMNENYYEYDEESAANLFAGMVLMPEQSFKNMFRNFSIETENTVEIIANLMNYYEVPYMAALIRCYELELLEAGEKLQILLNVREADIRSVFNDLWLDEHLLDAAYRDDYRSLEALVKICGEEYCEEGLLNESKVDKVLKKIDGLHRQITGV